MKKFNWLDWIAMVLLLIGGLNWGLVGVFQFDLVEYIFGSMTLGATIVYDLVGLSSLYMAWMVVVMQPDN